MWVETDTGGEGGETRAWPPAVWPPIMFPVIALSFSTFDRPTQLFSQGLEGFASILVRIIPCISFSLSRRAEIPVFISRSVYFIHYFFL